MAFSFPIKIDLLNKCITYEFIKKERKEKKYTYHGGMDSAIINHGRMDSF